MKDNPLMHYYASIYALSMAVMLILKAARGVVSEGMHWGLCSSSPWWLCGQASAWHLLDLF